MSPQPFRSSVFCYLLRVLAWLALTVGVIGTLMNSGPGAAGPALAFAISGFAVLVALFIAVKVLDLLAEIRDAAVRAAPDRPATKGAGEARSHG